MEKDENKIIDEHIKTTERIMFVYFVSFAIMILLILIFGEELN